MIGAVLTSGGIAYTWGKEGLPSLAELREAFYKYFAAICLERAGLQLNEADPFSDASFAHALTLKTGVTIRSVMDRAMIEEDVETFALGKISENTGFTLTTLRDREVLKSELIRNGLAMVQERVGIPLTPMPESADDWPAHVRESVLAWAQAEVATRASAAVARAVDEYLQHYDLEGLAGSMNQQLQEMGSVQRVDVRGLALDLAQKVADQSISRFKADSEGKAKLGRRQLQLREAQRRFREKWGNRAGYVSVKSEGPPASNP